VVHRFHLIGYFDRLNSHFASLNTRFAQTMGYTADDRLFTV